MFRNSKIEKEKLIDMKNQRDERWEGGKCVEIQEFLFRISSLRRVRFVSMAQKSSNFGIFDAGECDPNFLFTGITSSHCLSFEVIPDLIFILDLMMKQWKMNEPSLLFKYVKVYDLDT